MSSSHGDLFPLPLLPESEPRASNKLSRGVRQRIGARRAMVSLINETVKALNSFAGGHSSASRVDGAARCASTASVAQQEVLSHIGDCHALFVQPERTTQESLRTILQADTVYDRGSATQLASYVPGRVSLPEKAVFDCWLSEHLEGEAKRFFDDFESLGILTEEEFAGRTEGGRAVMHVDPALANNVSLYEDFIVDLYNRGLAEFTGEVKVINGLFFVTKKNGLLRFILDARRCNEYFRTPPSGECCTAAAFAHLRVPQGMQLFSAAYDVKDFFFRLRIGSKLGRYFGLPRVNARRVAQRLGLDVLPGILTSCVWAFPCLTVLPMGFSWAPYFATAALRFCISAALGPTAFMSDFAAAPDVSRTVAVATVVDNGVHMGCSREAVQDSKDKVVAYLNAHGLLTHDESDVSLETVSLGVVIDGKRLLIRPRPGRVGRLRAALVPIIRGFQVTGHDIEIIYGHLVPIMLLSRWMLCTLMHGYRFISAHRFTKTRVWPSLRTELEVIRALLPLVRADISSNPSSIVYGFDACLQGYAVTQRDAATNVEDILAIHERWRFRDEGVVSVGARARALGELGIKQQGEFATVRSTLRGEVARGRSAFAGFAEIPKELLLFHRWRLIWASPLRFKEVIHVCECRGLFGLIRHLSRSRGNYGLEILILTDSMCVALATDKGRSSDEALNLSFQRCLPFIVCCGFRPRLRWIPSEWNTADAGSHIFDLLRRRPKSYEQHLVYPHRRAIVSCSDVGDREPRDHRSTPAFQYEPEGGVDRAVLDCTFPEVHSDVVRSFVSSAASRGDDFVEPKRDRRFAVRREFQGSPARDSRPSTSFNRRFNVSPSKFVPWNTPPRLHLLKKASRTS